MRRIVTGLGVLAVGLVGSVAQADVKIPKRFIDRPLSTPGGQLDVGGDLGILSFKTVDLMGEETRETSMALNIPVAYGVSDQLEVHASYAFGLKEFEAKGTLLVGAAYGLMQSGSLLITPHAHVGYDLLGEGLAPLNIGARIQFMLNKDMDIHSPGYQLEVTLDGQEDGMGNSVNPIFLRLPVGFGYQSGDSLYVYVDTSIGTIEIADSSSGFLFADFIPLKIGAWFSPSNALDFGGAIDFLDLKEIGFDIVAVFVSARLHM